MLTASGANLLAAVASEHGHHLQVLDCTVTGWELRPGVTHLECYVLIRDLCHASAHTASPSKSVWPAHQPHSMTRVQPRKLAPGQAAASAPGAS